MSVLYKALAKAAQARESLGGGGPALASAMSVTAAPMSRGRRRLRIVGIVVAVYASASLVIFTVFGDQLSTLMQQSMDRLPTLTEVIPMPGGPAPLPAPIAKPPVQPAIVAQAPAPAPAPQMFAPPPQATLPSSAPPPPPPALAAAPPPAMLPVLHPVARAAKPPAAPVANDEDLPALLDRIRRQKTAQTLESGVEVRRGPKSSDLANNEGQSAVTVSTSAPRGREEGEQAYDLLLHGRYEEALGLYAKTLRADPANPSALLGKATALHKLGRFNEAQQTYRQVLTLDSSNREALTNLMAIIANQSPDQALGQLHALQKTYPSFSPVAAGIAEIEARQGNLNDAVAQLAKAIALSPDNGLYRLNLAVLLDRSGMGDEAAASYQAALTMLDGQTTTLPLPIEQIRERLRYLQRR